MAAATINHSSLPTSRDRQGAGIFFVAILASLLLPGCHDADSAQHTQSVEIAGKTFTLELATTPDARYQGLSDRPSIPLDGGMLFVFPRPGVLQFVMRRCQVPIDLVFLDPGGRVVGMHAMRVEPPDTPEDRLRRYSSLWPAQFAIELAGGTIDSLGLKTGTKIGLPLDALKRLAR